MPSIRLSFRDRAALMFRAFAGDMPTDPGSVGGRLLAGVVQGYGQPPKRGTREQLMAYSTMPWLRAVVARISFDTASTQWQLYVKRTGAGLDRRAVRDGQIKALQSPAGGQAKRHAAIKSAVNARELEELTEHPLLDLLSGFNVFHTGHAGRRLTQQHLDLVGEAYWLLERDRRGMPAAVWPVPPAWILATPSPMKPFFRVSFRAWQGLVPATEMVWFCDPDPWNPYWRGSGTAQALADELETDEYAAKHTKAFFYNSGRPDLIVAPKGDDTTMQESEVRRLEENWNSRSQGFWRAFKPFFVRRAVEVTPLEQSFRSQQFVQIRQFERDTIIQVFGVSPEILGIIASSANRACHSDDTECLTRAGWKSHETLTLDDEIATWNAGAERFEYQHPSQVVRYPYAGPMHAWRTTRVDVLVTPDHRMWTQTQFRGGFEIRRSFELAGKKLQQKWRATGGGYDPPAARVRIGGGGYLTHRDKERPIDVDDVTFARFLGYWLSEGSQSWAGEPGSGPSYEIKISQNDGPLAWKMKAAFQALDAGEVLNRTQVQAHVLKSYHLAHKGLWMWLRDYCGFGCSIKRMPREVFGWSAAAQVALLEALMEGDGSKAAPGTPSGHYSDRFYGTTSRALADDVQHLCVQLGLRASVASREGVPPRVDGYVVGISSKQHVYVSTSKVGEPKRAPESPFSEKSYDGIVWCVEVPNHLFFTRRNGKVALHGNTITMAEYIYGRRVLIPRLELQRATLQERLVPEYDERLVLDYVSPVSRDLELELEAAKVAPYVLSMDEWRARMGEAALPDGAGEVHLVPPMLTPMRPSELALRPPLGDQPAVPSASEPLALPKGEPAQAAWDRFVR